MVFNTNILAGSGGQDSGTAFSPVGLDFKNSAGSTNNYAHFVASVAATVSSPFSNKAPDGFHWMKKGSSYKLMKHSGKFKSHKGASLTAKFEVQKKHG